MIRSCGAVIFRRNGKDIEYLVLKAYANWDFPKGVVDFEDKNFVETAKREIEEETSLKHIAFVIKNKKKLFIETEPYGRQNKIARYYLCYVSYEDSLGVELKVNPELGKPEHDKFSWVLYENAFKLFNERLRKVINWADKTIMESM